MDRGPFGESFEVAFFHLHELGLNGETRLNVEMEGAVILKLDGQGVVIGAGEEFHFLGHLPFDEREGDEAPEGKRSFLKGQFPGRWFVFA